MGRSVSSVVCLLLISASGGASAQLQAAQQPGMFLRPEESVVIKSVPESADITVDGKFVGSTPSTLRLTLGDHTISVEKSGFKPWQRTLSISAGGSVTINATLDNAARAPGQSNNSDYILMLGGGGFKLTLGLPQETVMAQLAKQGLKAQPDGKPRNGESRWTVQFKSRRYLTLIFTANQLSLVEENIGPLDYQAGFSFAQTLWQAMSDFQYEGRTSCRIDSFSFANVGITTLGGNILCGGKSIDFHVMYTDTGDPRRK